MSTSQTGNVTHDKKVNQAEAVRQASITASASQATAITADVTFHQTAALSAIANGISPSCFLLALQELRRGLY